MKKIAILSILVANFAFGSDVQWGHGTMELKGGFLGLNETISGDVNTYSLVEEHKNLLGTNVFYGYNFTYFDSKKMKQLQKEYNAGASSANSFVKKSGLDSKTIKIPEMEYRLQGVDAGVTLGYDLLHNSEDNYLGLGLYAGLSVPSIKSNKSNSSSKISDAIDLYKASKTDISTYKIGAGVYAQKSLTPFLSLYSNAIYAYQSGNIKNDYARSDFDANGNYFEVGAGLKLSAKANMGILSPRVYGTIGWKYRKWQVDDVSIDISGGSLKAPKSNMQFSSNTFNLGFGYSF
jgi:hypothetical protein